jgi:NADH-quinone oxidoreductase subunit M
MAALYLVFALASIGLPGTSGFPAELLLLVSALTTHTGAGVAALFGMVIAAGYTLGNYRRTFFGLVSNPAVAEADDLAPAEFAFALGVAVLVVALGMYPALFLDLIAPAAEAWLRRGG